MLVASMKQQQRREGVAKAIDLTDHRFGRLVVVGRADPSGAVRRHARWVCACDCGNQCRVTSAELRTGSTASCGCYRREKIAARNTTHGMYNTAENAAWHGMWQRCTNEQAPNYHRYGGRGITVCKEWESFEQFLKDMGLRPSAEHSLDRRDNEKGYSPDNCRWATPEEQHENRSNTCKAEWNGILLPILHIAQQTGKKRSSIYYHLRVVGLPIEEAVARAKKESQ